MNNDGRTPDMSNELVLKLFAMRDLLTQVAMLLRDMQFALDFKARRLTQDATDQILERHGCDPGALRPGDSVGSRGRPG